MKKVIYLNAGHSLTDPGAVSRFGKESDFNRKIRDALIPELQNNGFEVQVVPDNLNLIQSIKWVNQRTKSLNDGLALSIHCNAGGGTGAECYYYGGNVTSKNLASKLLSEYCRVTGLRNRGVKPDTSTRFKRLGWVRDTRPWALLLEAGFIDNPEDVKKLRNYSLIAKGIVKGVCNIFGIPYKDKEKETKDLKEQIRNNEALIKQLREEKTRLQRQLAQEKEKISELSFELHQLKRQKKELEEKVKNLNNTNTQLKNENKKMREEIQSLKKYLKELDKLKQEILIISNEKSKLLEKDKELEKENKKLKEQIEKLKRSYSFKNLKYNMPLDGYKTYIVGVLMIITGLILIANGNESQGVELVLLGLGALTGKHAIKKVEDAVKRIENK